MSTERKIQDYLHLYMGAEANMPGHKVIISHALLADEYVMKHYGVRPILRPLNSMTEDEGREYAAHYGIKGHLPCTISEENGFVKIAIGNKDHGASLFPMGQYGQKPESLRYLLSRHFDLFNLIPDGLAINKTTLKP